MVEKPNKDGKPPTVEYQEEEIIVSNVWNDSWKYLMKTFLFYFTHPTEKRKIIFRLVCISVQMFKLSKILLFSKDP